MNSTDWNGEGLPPVGTVCEYYANDDDWRRCLIVGHHIGVAIAWVSHAHIFSTSGGILRPIRTPEQIAAEEREKAIDDLYRLLNTASSGKYHIAAHLYDAGYRKTE